MDTLQKPDCYKCKWRGDVAGDAHSCCNHPSNARLNADPLGQLLGILAGAGRVAAPVIGGTKLKIKANPHGVKMGWFTFPYNFDPTWLQECDGFEKKEK